jgi:hypothetical protein
VGAKNLEYIGTSKIGKLSAKIDVIYPQLRLPRKYCDVIGQNVRIFQTVQNGQLAFLIITEQNATNEQVLKLGAKVVKPLEEYSAEARLSKLESQIELLKAALPLNEGTNYHKNKNETDSEWAWPDSNRRPPPCQG